MTSYGPASKEALDELRELFDTRAHSPVWRVHNFQAIREIVGRGDPLTAAYVEAIAMRLRNEPVLDNRERAHDWQYQRMAELLTYKAVPEHFAVWVSERLITKKLSRAFADLVIDDLDKMLPAARDSVQALAGNRCRACGRPIQPDPSNPGYEQGYGRTCWKKLQLADTPRLLEATRA
ncbi:hypothetical protein [Actinoplanes sp. URMC 104]|uniref:hypothetical protein n=1 Tax=Actinoplanes sp. URMC 104 TaxID=3423409 RepID=UPI003F1C8C68